MEDNKHWEAGKCLESLLSSIELSEFGFRIQGMAAHVLLRLGARILEINSQGHPDIMAESGTGRIFVEVEADIHQLRPRALTDEDLKGITPLRFGDSGYFAVALCSPFPRWLLIEHSRLQRRRGIPALPSVLRALANKDISNLWTSAFIDFLTTNCQNLKYFSYQFLEQRAIEGRPL